MTQSLTVGCFFGTSIAAGKPTCLPGTSLDVPCWSAVSGAQSCQAEEPGDDGGATLRGWGVLWRHVGNAADGDTKRINRQDYEQKVPMYFYQRY